MNLWSFYGLRYEMVVTLLILPLSVLRHVPYVLHAVQVFLFFSWLSLQIPGQICEDFNDSVGLGRTNYGCQVAYILYHGAQYLGVLTAEFTFCHAFGAQKSEVAPIYLKICVLLLQDMHVFRLSLADRVQYSRRTEFCRIISVLTEYLLILFRASGRYSVCVILVRLSLLLSVAHLFKLHTVVLFVYLLHLRQLIFCLEIKCCHQNECCMEIPKSYFNYRMF